jgi:hypothetical protein
MSFLGITLAMVVGAAVADTPFVQEYHEAHPFEGAAKDVRAVAVDAEGVVWAATRDGVRTLRDGSWSSPTGAPQGPTFDVTVDADGVVWIGAWDGLYLYEDGTFERVADVDGPISVLVSADEQLHALGLGGLWTQNGARWRHRKAEWSRSIGGAAVGENGTLWLAAGNGLYEVEGKSITHRHVAEGLISGAAAGVDIDSEGRVWVGETGGVTVWRDGERIATYKPVDGVPSANVQCVRVAPDAVLWVGTDLGVTRFHRETWSLRHGRRWLVSDDVRDVAFDSAGTAWIATGEGVSAIKRRTMTMAEKAAHYQAICEARHIRKPGLVEKCLLRVPGDLTTWEFRDDDNDGQYTAMYLAMESFRYVVTKDPRAKANAARAYSALEFLETVTGTPGFVARTVIPITWDHMADPNHTYTDPERIDRQVGDVRWKYVPEMWRVSADGKWRWKGDTSSDEITGHMYGYLFYHDLVAEGDEKSRVAAHIARVVDYIVEGGYVLRDLDGEHTRWGVWSPEKLNGDPDWAAERGINSVEMLSYLKLAGHVTGDAKYERQYRALIDDHGYGETARRAKTYQLGWRTHIDDELLGLAYPALLMYEEDPELRGIYEESMDWWYRGTRQDRSPYFEFLYQSLRGEPCNMEVSVFFLRDTPLDMVRWLMDNSKREDLSVLRRPEIDAWQTDRLPPISERGGAMRWDRNPWHAIQGDGGRTESDGVFWLLPYWMGRYYGYLDGG